MAIQPVSAVPTDDLPANLVPADDLPDHVKAPQGDSVPTETVKASMPALGVLPGKLNLNAAIAPDVIAGAPRPFAPGEWVDNPDGSWSSEITGTISNPALNGGRATVVPTLWIVDGKPVRVDEDTAAAYAAKSGLKFPSYDSDAEAEAASVKREADWQGIDRHQAGSVKPLWVDTSGWDTPGAPVTEAVPFQDKPGTYRGNILPMARDAQGNLSAAVPGLLAAPVRGVIEGGQEARGVRPVDDPSARGDITAALGFGATPAAKMFATGAVKAATTLGDVSLGTAADEMADRPPIPFAKTPQGRAVKLLNKRVNEDIAGGDAKVAPLPPYARPEPFNPTAAPASPAENYVANLARMREAGKPATILDVGGASTEGLAGSRVRDPSTEASATRNFFRERDQGLTDPNTGMVDRSTGAGGRSEADVRQHLTDAHSAYRNQQDLLTQRSVEGNPLYKKAFEGGSMAPLKHQFETALADAGKVEKEAAQAVEVAKSQLNTALAKDPVTGGNVYSQSAANQAIRQARQQVQTAEQSLEAASAEKQTVLERARRAQQDIENDTPGAVWSPAIQRMLNLPEIKSGIQRGYAMERREAAGEQRAINAREYAVVGEDAEGNPIVGQVPTMRLLNVAKKGIDVQIAAERDKVTGRLSEQGKSLDILRRGLLKEMDRLNPDYAKAREVWAETSASLDAQAFGRGFANHSPEEIAETFANMSRTEQEFARAGMADRLLEGIGKTGLNADEAKAFVKSHWAEDQLQPFFKTQEAFVRYLKSVQDERLMKERPGKTMGGSQSVERLQQNQANDLASGIVHGGHAVTHFAAGNVPGFLSSALRAIRHLAPDQRQAVSDAILRQMRDTQTVPSVIDGRVDFGPPAPIPTMTVRPQ